MIHLDRAEIHWELNAYCKLQCSYCQPQFKTGQVMYSANQYLDVVEKLQKTRYKHHSHVLWKLTGGEPLNFPHLATLIKKIKEKSSTVCIATSGDDTWFPILEIVNLIDEIELTYHSWQNDDVFGFVLEQCQEKNVKISIHVPLVPGSIVESREKVNQYKALGFVVNEQILYDITGQLHRSYSNVDINRIYNRDDNAEFELEVPEYIDLSIVNSTDPIYTGKPCYAGVDWVHINTNGFASYSQCGGRNEDKNVFNPEWEPPSTAFPCTVNQCRSEQDRNKIRIITN